MKYRCEHCGEVFAPEDAGEFKEPHRLDGRTFYEPWAACPRCGGTDLGAVDDCPICGEWTRQGACQNCKREIRKVLNETMDMAKDRDGREAVLDEIQDFLEGYET